MDWKLKNYISNIVLQLNKHCLMKSCWWQHQQGRRQHQQREEKRFVSMMSVIVCRY